MAKEFNSLFFLLLISIGACRLPQSTNLVDAAHKGNVSRINELLASGADLNLQEKSGQTALHILCSLPDIQDKSQSNSDIISNLIQKGADINASDNNGRSPLFFAIQSGNYEAALALVNHGADVNKRDKNLRTPLFTAVSFIIAGKKEARSLQFVRLLYEAGADIFAKDIDGKNLIHNSKDPSATAWLIEHGLSPSLRDKYGKTPLDYSSAEILKARDSIVNSSAAKRKL